MSKKMIPVEESLTRWRKAPKYRAAYDALEEELSLASALIEARSRADMTQAEVASAMGTTQGVIARMESGRVALTTRTLQRFAKATGSRLRVTFEPQSPGPSKHQ